MVLCSISWYCVVLHGTVWYAGIILRIIGAKRIKNYSRIIGSHFGPKKNNGTKFWGHMIRESHPFADYD